MLMSFVDFPSTTPEPTTEPGMEGDIFVDFPSTTPEPATEPGMEGEVLYSVCT